ncbi:MAG: hypothetical protein A2600_12180 [Candidatus Lambdaproteobacteria bacterium RIFOXYD1_FULL_56_27]|uniref:Antitoxin SocA-like Panacea domain-containing protein n=1 Tax=Candidatus Lambdaproteobacteria bacterium RIFOXYD2_FULL_56_26 TaxID=1817773 RepID=A0A1F6GPQ1_9PROT|nr:MAG: hypothetical protein A2557_01315 [Candidatus Lambdaproteobacteria bacterium RIFOXYD2_FULL_56_26]OGH10008.1 MAG: hypothetical protein A2600_12180 [Candidatus Lambdaproteobacteria bacterium RIFOXYD1_FULL_56_27]
MLQEQKIAHLGAYLLMKSGGVMNYMKLLKLMYLSEREHLAQTGLSQTGDHLFSMDNGPVLSGTYDFIKRNDPNSPWGQMITKQGYNVSLIKSVSIEALDELCLLDQDILDEVWRQFGDYSEWDLVAHTHKHCSEWQDPEGTSLPIRYEAVFEAFGFKKEKISQLLQQMDAEKGLSMIFSRS